MEVDKHCGIPPVERERGNPMEMESMEAEVGKEANGGIQLLYIKNKIILLFHTLFCAS